MLLKYTSLDVRGAVLETAEQCERTNHEEVPRWLEALWYIFEPMSCIDRTLIRRQKRRRLYTHFACTQR